MLPLLYSIWTCRIPVTPIRRKRRPLKSHITRTFNQKILTSYSDDVPPTPLEIMSPLSSQLRKRWQQNWPRGFRSFFGSIRRPFMLFKPAITIYPSPTYQTTTQQIQGLWNVESMQYKLSYVKGQNKPQVDRVKSVLWWLHCIYRCSPLFWSLLWIFHLSNAPICYSFSYRLSSLVHLPPF